MDLIVEQFLRPSLLSVLVALLVALSFLKWGRSAGRKYHGEKEMHQRGTKAAWISVASLVVLAGSIAALLNASSEADNASLSQLYSLGVSAAELIAVLAMLSLAAAGGYWRGWETGRPSP